MTAIQWKSSLDTVLSNSKKIVFLDFWAEWCGPCRMLWPVLEQLVEKYPESIEVLKVNVDEDENQELAIMYWVRSIPQVNIFKDWKEVDKFIGALPLEEIEKYIAKYNS